MELVIGKEKKQQCELCKNFYPYTNELPKGFLLICQRCVDKMSDKSERKIFEPSVN